LPSAPHWVQCLPQLPAIAGGINKSDKKEKRFIQ
jgi:hypothetical protein